jgi:uncharacterized protein YegJ (DUF2314 family)
MGGGTVSYELANGLLLHAEHPDTFEIPTEDDKAAIGVDDFVKLIFQQGGAMPERMWVLVTEVDGDKLCGTLANEPINMESLAYGDEVLFGAEHIVSVLDRR